MSELRRLRESIADLLVGQRREMIIPQADGVERTWLKGTDKLVDFGRKRAACVGRTDGSSDGDVGGAEPLERAHHDADREAGGDAIIDEDDLTAGDFGRAPTGAINGFAASQLGEFTGDDRVHLGRRDFFHRDERFIKETNAAARDGADREFLVPRVTELAHEGDVERRVERAGNFKADGDAAARESEDEGALPRVRLGEDPGECPAGIGAITVANGGCHDESAQIISGSAPVALRQRQARYHRIE